MAKWSDASRRLSAMREIQPEQFKGEVRTALSRAGDVPGAALSLGVSERTVRGWLVEMPELREGIALRPRGERGHSEKWAETRLSHARAESQPRKRGARSRAH